MEVVVNGRAVPKAEAPTVLLGATARFRERQAERIASRVSRLPAAPERRSVSLAMLAVEIRLVKAFWTIARLPAKQLPTASSRNGVDYLHEKERDRDAAYRDAAGGDWSSVAPRPPLPSSKAIDDANAALDWLLLIDDEGLRKILVIGATSKRGDAGRNINWGRVRATLPELSGYSVRWLRNRYREALRTIVAEMTIARMSFVP